MSTRETAVILVHRGALGWYFNFPEDFDMGRRFAFTLNGVRRRIQRRERRLARSDVRARNVHAMEVSK